MLGFTIKAVLLVYFAFMVLFLALRYAILPNIDIYKPDIERAASRALGNQVTIARVYASWRGLHPNLYLGDLRLHDRAGRQLLALPSVSATVSWWSVVAAEPRFEALEINRPELDVRRGLDGVIAVAGVRIDPNKKERAAAPTGCCASARSSSAKAACRGPTSCAARRRSTLSDVTLVLQNRWTTHRFALKAAPPPGAGDRSTCARASPIPPFGARPSDARRWKGQVYADVRNTDLAAWKQNVDYPFTVQAGPRLRARVARLRPCAPGRLTADLALAGVSARLGPTRRRWRWRACRAGCPPARPSRRTWTTASRPSARSATPSAWRTSPS